MNSVGARGALIVMSDERSCSSAARERLRTIPQQGKRDAEPVYRNHGPGTSIEVDILNRATGEAGCGPNRGKPATPQCSVDVGT